MRLDPDYVEVAFVAHPVRGDLDANLARARRWLRWLISEYPDTSFNLGWEVYCRVLDDAKPEERARGMRDARAQLTRCDTIFVVGGATTPGMKEEVALAGSCGLAIVDLTSMGEEPPELS